MVAASINEGNSNQPKVDTLELRELANHGSFEIRTTQADENAQITVILEEFDTLDLTTIDLGIIELSRESATT